MKLLIVEDDAASRGMIASVLASCPLEIVEAADADEAMARVERDAPAMILLDWLLPGKSGLEVCMLVRQRNVQARPYVIMVSSRESNDDAVSAFAAGADDYVTTPFHAGHLRARVTAGLRLVLREHALVLEHAALQSALRRMHALPELVPICSCCKRVNDGEEAWVPVDRYMTVHSGVHFTHGVCPTCAPQLMERR